MKGPDNDVFPVVVMARCTKESCDIVHLAVVTVHIGTPVVVALLTRVGVGVQQAVFATALTHVTAPRKAGVDGSICTDCCRLVAGISIPVHQRLELECSLRRGDRKRGQHICHGEAGNEGEGNELREHFDK